MPRPVLLAGLLGGLLGGVVSLTLSRWIVPVKPDAVKADDGGAREVADGYVSLLKAGRLDDFAAAAVHTSKPNDAAAAASFRQDVTAAREVYAREFGPTTGEFEFLRETVLGPSLARVVYLEKHTRGGVLWVFVLYRPAADWQVLTVHWDSKLVQIFGGLQ